MQWAELTLAHTTIPRLPSPLSPIQLHIRASYAHRYVFLKFQMVCLTFDRVSVLQAVSTKTRRDIAHLPGRFAWKGFDIRISLNNAYVYTISRSVPVSFDNNCMNRHLRLTTIEPSVAPPLQRSAQNQVDTSIEYARGHLQSDFEDKRTTFLEIPMKCPVRPGIRKSTVSW